MPTAVHLRSVLASLCLVGACGDSTSSDDDAAAASSTGSDTTTSEASESTRGPADGDTTSPGEASTSADDDSSTGSDPLAICDAAPCGGDLVGTWSYDILLCDELVPIPSNTCDGGYNITYQDIEGTLELTADGSSILHRRLRDHFIAHTPKSCIEGDDCSAVYVDYECVDDGEVCDCETVLYQEWIDEVTPYSIDGTAVVFHEPEGDEAIDYCVTDGAMALIHEEIAEWTYFVEDAPG